MNPTSSERGAPAPAVIEAIVQTSDGATTYRRAGRGAPVLLLAGGAAGARLEAELLADLAAHFLVIAPQTNGVSLEGATPDRRAGAAAASRLRDLIDGLGLERPSIVADEAFGIAALGFAIADPERMQRLVVLCRAHDALGAFHDAVDDALARAGHRFMLLRTNAAAAPELLTPPARAALRRFLAGEP